MPQGFKITAATRDHNQYSKPPHHYEFFWKITRVS